MERLICRDRLSFLSSQHKSILSEHFSKANTTAQPRELAIKLGIGYSQIIAVLAVLAADGYCQNWLLIYHTCSEAVVDKIHLRLGMPKLPYICPYCDMEVHSYDDLLFDVMAETTNPVEFI
jgi:coproporphyrinogen III oxidase-like Fe-S oxidoreductase